MPITKGDASKLVKRLLTLRPSNVIAFGAEAADVRREMQDALATYARTLDHAERVVHEIMDTSEFMPTRSQIRMVCEQTAIQREAEKKERCNECGGNMWLTQWRLVTYKPDRITVHRAQRFEGDTDYETAMNFARKIQTGPETFQSVLSCAVPCGCMPATHKYRTGERP